MSILERLLREPTALVEVLRQLVLWGLAMGFVQMTADQQAQTLALASAILMVINRALVTPADPRGKHDA